MHCFYLAKRGGRGYRERLKRLWDLRNPDKTVAGVNTLCCHARNIQETHMLSDYELQRIEQSCTRGSASADHESVLEVLPTRTQGTLLEFVEVPGMGTDDPSVTPSIVILGDSVVSRTLSNKLAELLWKSGTERLCLPRVTVNKLLDDTVSAVNECVEHLLVESPAPSLLQCVHLLYAAATTVAELVRQPQSSRHHSGGSWRTRLEKAIQDLRRYLSRLVSGGFPPCGGRRLLYLLAGLHRKYCITSVYSFQVGVETLKQKVSSYATRLRKYKL